MDLLAAWLLYPLVALVVVLGVGLLIDRASGSRLPGVLVLPVGVAGLIAFTQPTTYADWSAELTVPLAVGLAVAGLAFGYRRVRLQAVDPVLLVAVGGVFAVFAAPVVLSGAATFAGYTVLGDTSIHMIGADALLRYGRDFGALPPSSYELSLVNYFQGGYPAGGPVAAGVLTSLVGLDVAWTFQPLLTLLVAMMALALWSLSSPLVESRPLRALLVFVAAQPALVLGYALQGSIKEVGTAFAVVLVAALVPEYARTERAGYQAPVPLAVATGATVAIVGLAAAVWLGPLLIGALVARVACARARPRILGVEIVVFALLASFLGIQSILELTRYVEVTRAVVTAQSELGNLSGPLDSLQMFGIWLTGDYRRPPTDRRLTDVLIAVAIVATVLGVVWMIRRRSWPQLLFFGVSVFAWFYVTRRGSPWADGKALVIVSPAIMFAAGLGAASIHGPRWRSTAAYGLAGVLAFGVLLSNAWAYYEVSLAPRDRMNELRVIGERLEGQGPTLYTEFEEFAKHLLRSMAPEGPSEGWQRRYALALEKQSPRFGYASDPDQFTERYLTYYRTIVARRGFAASRPPSIYRRVMQTAHYDVWQRDPDAPRLLAHMGVGVPRQPVAEPPCRDVRRLARLALSEGGALAYVERPPNLIMWPTAQGLPSRWFVDPSDGATVRTIGPGRLFLPVEIARGGRYDVWLEGSFGRAIEVDVDGQHVGKVGDALNNRLVAERAGSVELDRGKHVMQLVRGGRTLAPGGGGGNRLLGPVVLTPPDPGGLPVKTIHANDWRTLCGRSVDWIDAVGSDERDRR